jgi:hypothetical protein
MIKCLECGFESERLQWTHFKYKCTGKFKNGVEYMAAYPGAKVVSSTLAKCTAVTLNNLVKKYGQEEGKTRWERYCGRQSNSNTYEYKKEKYGWSKEEFDEYNSSRAQTLQKMIARHGEEVGAAKWENYCLRQAYTNTKTYFIEKYGQDVGTFLYLAVNKKKSLASNPALLAEHLHITEEEATQIIMSRKSTQHCSNLENEFVVMLEDAIGFKLDHTSVNSPFGKWSTLLNSYVIYDVVHKNCIIEFNGDYWHANPDIYVESALIRGRSAVDIWHKDMLKLKTAEDLGFKVITVWEQEFKSSKALTIERVIKWMLSELK